MIQFPINPTLNQEYSFNQRSWIWDGVSWNLKPFQETDPVFNASQAKNITSTHISVLNNTSGTNTGDQDLSGLVEKKANHSLVPDLEIEKLSEYPELLEETTNKIISDTGELISIPTPSGGYANNLYLGETDSDVAGYKILTYIADTAETIKTVTANSSAGVVMAQTFLYPTGVSISNFPSGLWSLKLWGNISASAGVSQVGFTYFKRSVAGIETDLFTLWSEEVNNTSDIWIDVIGTQPSYSVDPTDRMGLRLLFKTTSGTNKTLTYSIGDGYAAFVNNPNQIRHSQTRDKNGEAAFQHIDTTTTKTTLAEADMVAIKDSATGNVVLTPKSNFESEYLVVDYTHSANTEIAVTNVDVDTNTFTSANHGLVNGTVIAPTLNDSNNISIYPLQVYPGGIKQQPYYIVNKSDNTFQISATVSGAPIDITSIGDLSKWHFEISPASAITFTGLNSKRYRIIVEGKNLNMSANQYLLINDLNLTSTWMTPILTIFTLPFINTAGLSLRGYLDILVEVGTDLFTTIRVIGNVYNVNNNNAAAFTANAINNTLIQSIKGQYSNITQLTFNDIGRLANGSKIKIYRL